MKKKKGTTGQGGIWLIRVAVAAIVLVLVISGIGVWQKIRIYQEEADTLQTQLENQEARTAQLDAYELYMETDEYVEEVAREQLGMAYPNEILFRPED